MPEESAEKRHLGPADLRYVLENRNALVEYEPYRDEQSEAVNAGQIKPYLPRSVLYNGFLPFLSMAALYHEF